MKKILFHAILSLGFIYGVPGNFDVNNEVFAEERGSVALTIRSASFAHQGEIPVLYTCDGKNISPPLSWSGVPKDTKSLVLIVDDPDAPDPRAPKMTWVHWVLYNIPTAASSLSKAVPPLALPKGTREGLSNWGETGYGGALSTHRAPPLFPQTICSGYGFAGLEKSYQDQTGAGHERSHLG